MPVSSLRRLPPLFFSRSSCLAALPSRPVQLSPCRRVAGAAADGTPVILFLYSTTATTATSATT